MKTTSSKSRYFMLLWLVVPALFIIWLGASLMGKYMPVEPASKIEQAKPREVPREVPISDTEPAYEE